MRELSGKFGKSFIMAAFQIARLVTHQLLLADRPILTTLFIASVLTPAMCSTAASSQFDYSQEGLRSLEVVKQEYGEKPLDALKPALSNKTMDYLAWRRAVAAFAFLGSDGAAALKDKIESNIKAGDYSERTTEMVLSLGRIVDTRATEVSLTVLGSSAPASLKKTAADIVIKQMKAAGWWAEPVSMPGPPGHGEVSYSCSTTTSVTCGETYSFGQVYDRPSVMRIRKALLDLLPELQKQDAIMAETVTVAVSTIDKKESDLQASVEAAKRKYERK